MLAFLLDGIQLLRQLAVGRLLAIVLIECFHLLAEVKLTELRALRADHPGQAGGGSCLFLDWRVVLGPSRGKLLLDPIVHTRVMGHLSAMGLQSQLFLVSCP